MDEKYVDSFLNEGLLYMNNIHFFRTYEDREVALRGDTHEGLEASLLPEEITLQIGNQVITGATGKIDIRQCHHDETNIYSLTVVSDQDILSAGEAGLYLPRDFERFGNKAVYIGGNDINEFWARLKTTYTSDPSIYALEKDNIIARKIKYVDRNKHHLQLGVFSKFNEYAWQLEWRIALKQITSKGPLLLKIGSIADIAHVMNTKDLLETAIKFHKHH
ncbi:MULTISPECIES: hypothetical protein [Stutzerimonas stutzeri subgroup]|uniref:hypothetical protein n=1 Tax=Stutzerimonas stutzeri subgroup TaxID=578833 RepID=UPI000F84008C|nr:MULTISPECIES: hypothetical protein [Stutzerimonas stutzeri subgroup]MCQ2045313.1 hypothetical protein [Stutzerimonas kunmingensis]QQC10880.1 hypothetical protein I6I22_18965 [Stutzerimonas stutzeri]